jgi:hypothetical protein
MKFTKMFIRAIDYMYYRIAKAYHKWDGKEGSTAIFTISLFYCFITCLPVMLLLRLLGGRLFFREIGDIAKPTFVIIAILIFVLNFIKYRRKYEILNEIYKNENTKIKSIKGVLVVLVLVLPLLTFIIVAVCI